MIVNIAVRKAILQSSWTFEVLNFDILVNNLGDLNIQSFGFWHFGSYSNWGNLDAQSFGVFFNGVAFCVIGLVYISLLEMMKQPAIWFMCWTIMIIEKRLNALQAFFLKAVQFD